MAQSPIYIRARARAMSVTFGTLQRTTFRDEDGDVIFHMSSTISHPTTKTALARERDRKCHATTIHSFTIAKQLLRLSCQSAMIASEMPDPCSSAR
jgi:hypothetical protein